jgi:hypothetical protein
VKTLGKVIYIDRSPRPISSIRPLGLSEKRWTWNRRKAGLNFGTLFAVLFCVAFWLAVLIWGPWNFGY